MGFHTFDPDRAERLDDPARYRFCSSEELRSLLAPHAGMIAADLGSGTGFHTEDLAPHVETMYAVDVQSVMHDYYAEKGRHENVVSITADVADLPMDDDTLDAAFSTMTYHEFASDEAIAELGRVLRPGGRLVTVDWAKNGAGDDGPPLTERFGLDDAVAHLTAQGFEIERAETRSETFVCVSRRTV